ncbi:MAG TPA: sialidase family protein [Gaiellaceae bacterium]|jgi:hypothetical protein|nr:sialidase family protein [Gaiellaceae bacterium]
MTRIALACAAIAALTVTTGASAAGWSTSVPFTNQVAGNVITGGGYPVPAGQTAPDPGTCRLGKYNANRSESWIAVKPGTEDLVGTSKIFFEKYSTFYDFHLGAHTFKGGAYAGSSMVTGYECVSTGTQEMPPSWTNNTDPNVDFDTQGRAHQITLPFNAFWANLHPNGAIGASFSDDLGKTWTVGNGGEYLDFLPNSSSLAFGDVVDKQWVAVNKSAVSPFRDHVYGMWSTFNGDSVKIRFAKSVDRGVTFTPAKTISMPSETGPCVTFVYPSVDVVGTLYVAIASFACKSGSSDGRIFVTRSTDDGKTFSPWVYTGARARGTPTCCLPNTTFRDGILEHMVASPTHAGHVYVTYEDFDGTNFDTKFVQSTDGGVTWSVPVTVNDPSTVGDDTDQFQPSVAAGPGGGVAIAFYDRRQACPSDKSVRPQDVGRTNFCIDTSVQAYRDSGAGAVPVGSNVRVSQFTWDPEEPDQTIDGIDQMACAAHRDPCTIRSFIGDYFGLTMSATNVYALMVSTHYPSRVKADGGGPVFYQQQVLATVARSSLGN